jgi:hypothetical protein
LNPSHLTLITETDSDLLSRIAGYYITARDISGHHTSSKENCILTDCYTGAHKYLRRDPGTIANDDWCPGKWEARIVEIMARGTKIGPLAHGRVTTDTHRSDVVTIYAGGKTAPVLHMKVPWSPDLRGWIDKAPTLNSRTEYAQD